MGRPRAPNQKAVAAKERKAEAQAAKDAASARQKEAADAADWAKGSNARGAARADAAALKADEAARKKREKAELLAAEEAEMGGGGKPKKAAGAGMAAKKGKKKKKKDELGLLEEALVGDAEKKSKAAKKKEREKKEREERLRLERERKAAEEAKGKDPLLANTDAMIGATGGGEGDDDGGDGLGVPLAGRAANVAAAAESSGTGIEGALSALNTAGEGTPDQHPEKRVKALHRAFEERMMPEMKEKYPGLRQAQYKDKIFQLWKKSPENPMNQPR